ncbi:MAG: hypothetical protein QXJ17_06870 [Nitrososphaeria archaeon]
MSEPSSSLYVKNVIKLTFFKNRWVLAFYLCLFAVVILISTFIDYNGEFADLFYLSFSNPLGILTSLFLHPNITNGIVNVVSAFFIVFTYLFVKALIDAYNIISSEGLTNYFILTPLLASIASNFLIYVAMFLVEDYQSLQFSGFQGVVQGLIGFMLSILLVAFLKVRNWSRHLPVFVALFLVTSVGYLMLRSFLSGFNPSTLYDFSKLLSLQVAFFTGLTSLQIIRRKQKVG